jgi:hypothetical protein
MHALILEFFTKYITHLCFVPDYVMEVTSPEPLVGLAYLTLASNLIEHKDVTKIWQLNSAPNQTTSIIYTKIWQSSLAQNQTL